MKSSEGKKQDVLLNKSASFTKDQNHFYSRFDNLPCSDNSTDNDNFDIFTNTTEHSMTVLTEAEVAASPARTKPSKAPGPGGLRGRVINHVGFSSQQFLQNSFLSLRGPEQQTSC